MSSNNAWSGANNPSLVKSTRGILGSTGLLGTPISSASRIISRLLKGVPPQYVASYFAKYQPQLGSRFSGMSCIGVPSIAVPGALPQISKATWRTAFGVVLSIVSTLGRLVGTGNGPVGSRM